MAGTSFAAATSVTISLANPKGFTKSNNVSFGYESGANGSVNDRYSISTKHASGDKIYGTTSASGTIYYSVVVPTTTFATSHNPTLPTTSTDSTMAGGAGSWVAM